MTEELKKEIEDLTPGAIKQAKATVFANKLVQVSGERHMLPLDGREIEIVYYKAKSENAPLIIGYHGGGFLFGGAALDDDMWTHVCEVLDCNIASVGYRQSPDYKWQHCLSDAYDSAVYLKKHADEFGFDPKHISVMGQSAGGNLAAAVTLKDNMMHNIRLENQILVYPYLDLFRDPDEKGPEGSLSRSMSHVMRDQHVNKAEAKHPLVSPYYAADALLKDSPNTIIIFSDDDYLKHEAIEYGEKLKNLGVDVKTQLAKDMPHGFFESGFKKKITEFEYNFLGAHAKEIIENGSLRARSDEALEFIKKEMKI